MWTWVSDKEVWAKSAFHIEKPIVGCILAKLNSYLEMHIWLRFSGFLALVDLSRRRPTLSIADMSPVRAGAVYWRRSEVDYWKVHPVAIWIWTKSGSKTFNWTWKPERKAVRSAGAAISTWAVSASREPSPGRDKPWIFNQFSFWDVGGEPWPCWSPRWWTCAGCHQGGCATQPGRGAEKFSSYC